MDVFHHPWLSGLFGDEPVAALWSEDAQLTHMLRFEAAFSRAMGAAGRFDADLAAQAADCIESATPDLDVLRDGSARDGLPVPALARVLRDGAGDAGAAIHTGATSQDVMDTALSLTMQATTALLDTRLAGIVDALAALSDRYGSVQMMGRTRMQAALPIAVADRVRQWRAPLIDHRARLDLIRAQTERLSLAGPTCTTDFTGVAGPMAQALGLIVAPPWHTDRSGVVAYGSLLAMITGSLGKMGQDIVLMAQQSPAEVVLSGGGGSSAMSHKQNPVLAELLVTLARFNAGQVGTLQQAMVHEQERSGSAWMLEWMVLPQMAQATGRALSAADTMLGRIERLGTDT